MKIQSNSFWDFKHKKIYTSTKEKLLDLIAGVIFIDLLATFFTDLWITLLPNIFHFWLQYLFCDFTGWRSSLSCTLFWVVSIVGLLAIIIHFFRIKRGYFSLGIILRVFISIAILFIGALMFLPM